MESRKLTSGDLFGHTPQQINKSVVRQSYANAIDSAARLTAYSLAERLVHADDEVAEHCRQLVADDLVHVSISLRRLIEATSLKTRAKNLWVSELRIASNNQDAKAFRTGLSSLWKLLGVVVHSNTIEIFDSRMLLAMWFGDSSIDVLSKRAFDKPQWIEPVCLVMSDKKAAAFHLNEFCFRAAELLHDAREVCDANGLFLSTWFKDM